jgi:hypothetical protein
MFLHLYLQKFKVNVLLCRLIYYEDVMIKGGLEGGDALISTLFINNIINLALRNRVLA